MAPSLGVALGPDHCAGVVGSTGPHIEHSLRTGPGDPRAMVLIHLRTRVTRRRRARRMKRVKKPGRR